MCLSELNEKDLLLAATITEKLAAEKTEELLGFIRTVDLFAITRLTDPSLYEQAAVIENFCKQNGLKAHWEALIKAQGLEDKPDFSMQPQYKIHPFDLLRSILYCKAYIRQHADQETCNRVYLERANMLGSFFASALLNKEYIRILQQKQSNKEIDIPELIEATSIVATKHGAPGHMLLALTYLHIGRNYYSDDDARTGQASIILSLTHFFIAWALETRSQAAINNAFAGAGFFTGFNGFYNLQIITSWDQIVASLKNGFMLTDCQVMSASQKADQEARQILAGIPNSFSL